MTGFEPATTRPPDVYSNRAELHPANASAKIILFLNTKKKISANLHFFVGVTRLELAASTSRT